MAGTLFEIIGGFLGFIWLISWTYAQDLVDVTRELPSGSCDQCRPPSCKEIGFESHAVSNSGGDREAGNVYSNSYIEL